MTVKERLIEFIKSVQNASDPNVSQFEKYCQLGNAYVKSIRKSIGPAAMNKIQEKYPQLNKLWLLHGEGEMLLSDTPSTETEGLKKRIENLELDMAILKQIIVSRSNDPAKNSSPSPQMKT